VFLFPDSLENLRLISQHSYFSQSIKEVKICLEWIKGGSQTPYKNGLTAVDYQKEYILNARWRQDLKEALKNFPNCTKIEIRDFQSTKRRPREGTHWRGYGARELQTSAAAAYSPHAPDYLTGEDLALLPNVIQAFTEANCPLINLEVITREICNATTPNGWSASVTTRPTASVQLSSLTKLMLCCIHPWNDWGSIRPFFRALVNLKHLRINFEETSNLTTAYGMMASNNSMFQVVTEELGDRSLKTLEIGKLNVTGDRLRTVLRSLKTVENLMFFRVYLQPPASGPGVANWMQVLEETKQLSNLQSVTARICQENGSLIVWKPSSASSDLWKHDGGRWPSEIGFKNTNGRNLEARNIDELKGRLLCLNEDFYLRLDRFHRDTIASLADAESNNESDASLF
jgi:hypothetical protein